MRQDWYWKIVLKIYRLHTSKIKKKMSVKLEFKRKSSKILLKNPIMEFFAIDEWLLQ